MQITSQKDVENYIMQKVVLQTQFDIFSFSGGYKETVLA